MTQALTEPRVPSSNAVQVPKMASDCEEDDKQQLVVAERRLLTALKNLPPPPDISQHINIRNAKIVAFLTVVGFIIYHSVLLSSVGSDSCKYLLSDGRFQGSMWQPYGCMMHTYNKWDARACMHYVSYWKGRNHIAFMGDAHIKSLFDDFIAIVDDDGSDQPNDIHVLDRKSMMYEPFGSNLTDDRSQHYEQSSIGLQVEYLAFPYIDDGYKAKISEWVHSSDTSRPTTIITGCALGLVNPEQRVKDKDDEKWRENLKATAKLFQQLQTKDITIVWNVQEPIFNEAKGEETNSNKALNHVIDMHNRAALEILENTPVMLWSSSRLIAQIFQKNATYINETIHSALDTQILLNYKCNDNMYYQDGTCCTTTEKPTLLQFISASFFGLCCCLSLVMFFACRRDIRVAKQQASEGKVTSSNTRKLPPTFTAAAYEILKGFSKLGLIVGFCFLCDRTTFFMKENKSYTHLNFFFPLGYVMLIGLFWAKDSTHTNFLHRDQTDEWKGWMQLTILIYHYTGASQVLPVYMFIRCLVSAYVFLSAYGNFMYCYNNGDYSLHRFITVLVRYNLLVVCLCMTMNRPYQFYYFVPLVTFSFVLLFLTLAVWPRTSLDSINRNWKTVWYVVIKLIILATLITLLHSFAPEVLFEKIFMFHPLKPLFVLGDNTVHEWWFRWSIDRYSSLFGLMFALFVVLSTKYKLIQDSDNESNLFKSDAALIITAFLSAAGFVAYGITILMCGAKEKCNRIHPIISFIPILGYIFIRNIIGPIRALYSPFFAWFGKFSLELFVAQYHIWLAADTHGILVLIPNYPIFNVAVTTFIFVCAAHELHTSTATLTVYLVPQDWRALLRNILLFISVMVPVAIYSGEFS